MTVEQYFLKEYGVKLRFPNMQCLWVGSQNKRIYIPSEVCTVIKGQVNNHKLGPDQVRCPVLVLSAAGGAGAHPITAIAGQDAYYNLLTG